MSADLLREAAAKMRERAQNIALTDWHCVDTTQERFSGYDVWTHDTETHWTVATSDYADTAEHIASWHPAVALAVSDWLEEVGKQAERDMGRKVAMYGAEHGPKFVADIPANALAVARAYLGRDS